MTEGSTPAEAPPANTAMGVTPSSLAFRSLITTTAAAPSLMPEALPAVTVPPSFLKAGFRAARSCTVTPGRKCSSREKGTVSFLTFTGTGTISPSNRPSFHAASHFRWLAAANSSCISRVIPYCSATFSAVMPMW
ncbi:hypothetical protein SDC9_193038 [bioreactor metagenome]|uniref:Uncharacterized protein n=1 Tax=bioreactor metagenome TaxID=1076179 RepID=A0A645I2E6_9ZZZZ